MKHNDWMISWVGTLIGLSIGEVHQIISIVVLGMTGSFTAYRFVHWYRNKDQKSKDDERPF